MEEEIYKIYEKIKDKLSEDDFLAQMEEQKNKHGSVEFISDIDIANLVVGEYRTEKIEPLSNKEQYLADKISKLEAGQHNVSIVGRVKLISNVKEFVTKKGKPGKLQNITLEDDTGNIKVVFWTENIALLKNVNEGTIVELINLNINDGYSGLEGSLFPRSSLKIIDETNSKFSQYDEIFPKYDEIITEIKDIVPDTQVNIIARIIGIGRIKTFEKENGQGQLCAIDLDDGTGTISYTLWNKDVNLIQSLNLNEGDAVKILSAQSRKRNDVISLNKWDGRIIKGDFDVPEYEPLNIKIADASEVKGVNLMGIITKIYDSVSFTRKDGSPGFVKNIEIRDDTGSIRVTFWGDDTNLPLNKGDIIKISKAEIKFDAYSSSGYVVNTNWNTRLEINPEEDNELIDTLKGYYGSIAPVKVEEVQNSEDDGEELDVRGRLMSLFDSHEFQREDGNIGIVRSGQFADETGLVRLSFWDEKAKIDLKIGNPYQLENARTRMGQYDVELNIGKTARVIALEEEDAKDLPLFETLEDMIYSHKKIMDIDEDDRNIRVIARIININDINQFQKADGSQGSVRNIEIADDTGSIRLALWNNEAEVQYEIGDAIKIENPRITYNNDHIELSVSNNSKVLTPTEGDLNKLPSFKELEDLIYRPKTIELLEDDDSNVKISGTLADLYSDKLLLPRCPHCNNTLDTSEEEYVCDYCGESVDEPNYLLMIPGRLDDDTGEISITFFGKLVEELLEMKQEEIVEIVEDSGDSGVLEGKVEDLEGMNVEIIADVNFNEFDEEIRLSPKKILSKSY